MICCYDEDGKPEICMPVKEEPDCPACCDTGRIYRPASWWRGPRLVRCGCDPSWWQWWWSVQRWLLRELRWKLTGRRVRATYNDEPPF